MSKKLENAIDALTPEELSVLVKDLVAQSKEAKAQISTLVAARDPAELSKILGKQITTLRAWAKRAHPYSSMEATQKILGIVGQIDRYIVKQSPAHAIKLFKRLIEIDQVLFACIDDSSGRMREAYYEIYALLDQAFALSNESAEAIADYYIEALSNDDYGVRSWWPDYIKRSLAGDKAEAFKRAIELHYPDKKDFYHLYLMRCYADLIKDVDLFIQLKKAGTRMSLEDVCEIAQRLLNAFRSEEAIQWLENAKAERFESDRERIDLLEQAYRDEGLDPKAKVLLFNRFKETLSSDYFARYLKYCNAGEKETAKAQALEFAKETPLLSRAVEFLADLSEWALVDALLIARASDIDGANYHEYRKISKMLGKSGYPLSAVLLRRAILEDILDAARSRAYKYAASDLKLCCEFAEQVKDWREFETQSQFIHRLKLEHGKKYSFWDQACDYAGVIY